MVTLVLFLRFILSLSVALVHACGLPKVTCDPFCARLLGTCVRRTTRSHVLYRQHHLGTRFHDHWLLCLHFLLPSGLMLRLQ